jgi:hypothetical protein
MDNKIIDCCYAECRKKLYAGCSMLSVIMLSVVAPENGKKLG